MTHAWAPWIAAVGLLVAGGSAALGHGHGGHGHGRNSQAKKDANSWRDGFRGPHDFGGGVKIPQDAGLNKGLGGGLDGRGFGRAATPLGKRLVLGVGVVGTSLATVGMRMYLMVDAGYTGAGDADADKHARVVKGPAHEQSLFQVMKDALKGFA